MDCIFCKIASGEIPSPHVYEDKNCVAVNDISPVAPMHVIFMPKKHIESLDKATIEDFAAISEIMKAIASFARDNGIAEDGYRVVNNCNEMGGQTVMHLHFHLLAGRNLQWPPG